MNCTQPAKRFNIKQKQVIQIARIPLVQLKKLSTTFLLLNQRVIPLLVLLLALPSGLGFAALPRPNVLMILVDDLRPALGCYGDPLAKTPNLDRFAQTARKFNRAYCHQAVCGPSRASILTGRLPDNTRVWHNRNRFRSAHPDLVTLPQLFKRNGWHAVGLGKVFSGNEKELDPVSWSEPEVLSREGWRNYVLRKPGGPKKGAPFEMADVEDEGYTDGKLATLAIETLERLKERPEAFFLAVGFFKPHLPFNAPRKYWDLHESTVFGPKTKSRRTRGAPEVAYPDQLELGGYIGVPRNETILPQQGSRLRHGYYACVSYVDAQIGRLLAALDSMKLDENTLVIVLGDHGFSLGEAGHWCKKTNFELDTHVPLLIRIPAMKYPGVATEAMVEFVDIFPTLAELAGLKGPAHLDGQSFLTLLENPSAKGREVVMSQHSRPWKAGQPETMGYSIRTSTHRYTRWIDWENRQMLAEELYDYTMAESVLHQGGSLIERLNLANEPSHRDKREDLRKMMDQRLIERSRPMALKGATKKEDDIVNRRK